MADITFSVAISKDHHDYTEDLSFTVDGKPVDAEEVTDSVGTRLHRIRKTPTGLLEVDYRAEIHGEADVPSPLGIEEVIYTRPSRYCDSDRLAVLGRTHFPGLEGPELMNAVATWINTNIAYVSGSSRVVDGALETYLSRKGVCRDFAHLLITFLRGMNVPARMASVYAPGLQPMDFHAVAEAYWDGTWYVLDPTGLAPRQSMVRIATGRDASDTAFMTTLAGRTQFKSMKVMATVDGNLPTDDRKTPVTLK